MSKIDVIMRELDWSGNCPIPIKDQVRFALMEVDASARQEENERCAKECDDRASAPDCVAGPQYKAGAKDCAIFIRGSLTRTGTPVMSARKESHSDFDRCSRCGDTLIADGTEEADWATMCPECDEEHRAELSGDQSDAL